MKKKFWNGRFAFMMAAALTVSALFAGCGSDSGTQEPANTEDSAQDATDTEDTADAADTTPADDAQETEGTEAEGEAEAENAAAPAETVVLKCVCDLTPHSEILDAAKDALAAEGIELDIVSTTWDATWNDMLIDGEVDFAYFMHVPAMESIEEEMGATLYSMGGVHVEPYACFSDQYASKDELPRMRLSLSLTMLPMSTGL